MEVTARGINKGGHLKVILLENNQASLDIMTTAMKSGWPYVRTRIVVTGAEGIRAVVKESPDLVLMGLSFPDVDGFDLIAQLRSLSDVPIIVLSDKAQEHDLVKGLESGADDYVVAPVAAGELLARIRALLRRQEVPEREVCDLGSLLLDLARHEARFSVSKGSMYKVHVN